LGRFVVVVVVSVQFETVVFVAVKCNEVFVRCERIMAGIVDVTVQCSGVVCDS
jgi:hypothetical protein